MLVGGCCYAKLNVQFPLPTVPSPQSSFKSINTRQSRQYRFILLNHALTCTTEDLKMYVCNVCGESYNDELLGIAHWEIFHNIITEDEETRPSVIQYAPPISLDIEMLAQALPRSSVRHYRIKNKNLDMDSYFNKIKPLIINTIKEELRRLDFIKFGLMLDATFTNIHNELSPRGFITRSRSIIRTSNLDSIINECLQELILKITEHEARGSSWQMLSINAIDLRIHKHGVGDRGSSYIPLPDKISNTKSCINVQNEDNECFRYAMLAKYISSHAEQPTAKYKELAFRYNFNGLQYPVSLTDINMFEKKNPGVSVNVFTLDGKNNVFPIRISNNEMIDHTDLLLLKKGNTAHYVYIKKFNTLVAKQVTKKTRAVTVCKRCFCFTSKKARVEGETWLANHSKFCKENAPAVIKVPTERNACIKFTKINQQYKIPIVIYADFEASLIPIQHHNIDLNTRNKYQKHEPNSFCLLIKSTLHDNYLQRFGLTSKPQLYRGERASEKFIDALYEITKKVEIMYKCIVPMLNLNDSEQRKHNSATKCYICENNFTTENVKVRDHDHLTGLYRGPACNNCNLNYKLPNFIPVVFHNLSGYDSHFIIPQLGRDKGSIDVLASTTEKFISFSKKIGKLKLRFIDSYRFLQSSLLKLSENLREQDLTETRKIVSDDKLSLVMKKGIFPYDYIDSHDKFNETSLPPEQEFYSKLLEEPVKPEDYQHACRVWTEMNMKTLGEYSDFYITLDVTLLCDVMEEFRNTCEEAYGLDPLHSYTSPGLAWQAMLKMTRQSLELLTDVEMLQMVESGIRGGLTQSVTRHVKANNKHVPEYDASKPSVYLGYFDANNLYGWAMSMPLPYGNFEWVDPSLLHDILNIPREEQTGYILDCDFEYPETLHDHHYDLPLLSKAEIPPEGKHKKLMMTLGNKHSYVAHFWVIQQAVQLGLRLVKINRALKFSQSCWLKPYIDYNTTRRAAATSQFQKDFYKLLNNSIFGKTLENKRKHKNVKLVTSDKKLQKLVQQPNFKTSIIINENLVAVCMNKTSIMMDRPLYIGMSILDISKTHMYDFHYNKMVKFYGRDNIGIAYMDTDAYLYWINTNDMYEDLRTFQHKEDFDFSDYPPHHPNYDQGKNKKVLGKFKDEANGTPLLEMVALMSKMYAIRILQENSTIKKAKGIKNIYLKKNITFEHYLKCLFENQQYTAKFNTIRSFNHEIYSITEVKKSLSAHDDKRKILQDNVHTLPFGHYSFAEIVD